VGASVPLARSSPFAKTALERLSMNRLCISSTMTQRAFSSNSNNDRNRPSSSQPPQKGKTINAVVSTSTSNKSPESTLEKWKKEIVNLSSQEIKLIEGNIKNQISDAPNDARQFLKSSGFSLEETQDLITLKKESPLYNVRVQFGVYDSEEDDDGEKPESNEREYEDFDRTKQSGEQSSDSEDESGEKELDSEEPKAKPIKLQADITFKDPSGALKGTLLISGDVGSDCRVYINDVQAFEKFDPTAESKILSEPSALFDRLNQDLQDRLYDILDEAGIDDHLGAYVRYFVDTYEDNQSIRVLETMKKIFSH